MLRAVTGMAASRAPSSTSTPAKEAPATNTSRFKWLYNTVMPLLENLSTRATAHPIHTFAFIALLVNIAYLKLLGTSLFEPPESPQTRIGQLDFSSLLGGSKALHISSETGWKWQTAESFSSADVSPTSQELALMTLVFPESTFRGSHVPMPQQRSFARFANGSFTALPESKNILSPLTQESTLAFSVSMKDASAFAASVKELGVYEAANLIDASNTHVGDGLDATPEEEKRWIMSAVKGDAGSTQRSFTKRAVDAWTAFIDILKNAEELDIVIMVLGYVSMHLTFVSLFMSMRKLGSNFWLGFAVLTSSVFALGFGMLVTLSLGVPLNMVLLSEGFPFLVVIIGFEKPIILTKAVLTASLALKKQRSAIPIEDKSLSSNSIQRAVQIAVKDCGPEIVRDYAIEIAILVLGAALGVQGGLCQFCFLAAWILFFDLICLFTFYTAILTIKLEINRIKRHVTLRRALEEDGVSRKVAEEVAASDEWPKQHLQSKGKPFAAGSIFGVNAGDDSISGFKFLMSTLFVGIVLFNIVTVPFRSGARSTGSTISSAVTQPPMDPFKVAGNGLETIAAAAKKAKLSTLITVLTPIKYELQYPSIHYAVPSDDEVSSIFDLDNFPRVVEGVLKSFEDPSLSKWIIIALAFSLILNGYLFNAARWSAHGTLESMTPTEPLTDGTATAPQLKAPPTKPLGKDESDDSDEGLQLAVKTKKPVAADTSRTPDECVALWKDNKGASLTNEEIIALLLKGKIAGYELEKKLGDMTRAVDVRRSMVARTPTTRDNSSSLEQSKLPFHHYEYERVFGACCENVIGYMPLPLGVAGPLIIDGKSYYLPMATTEGVLVASTSRGCKAINAGGGAVTVLTADGMTRGPCVGFTTLARAAEAKVWLDSPEGRKVMTDAFNSTSRFARLQSMKTALAGTYLYIRFKTTTGDAMGMNMISKGVEHALKIMSTEAGFEDMSIISVSGNYCIDKKAAAINWVDGRGKSVVAEAIIPGEVVRKVLKSNVDALVELFIAKNMIGSAMAGSIGGFNAHAANLVAAIFLATGQDPAQVVESSNCITTMKNHNGDLQIAVSMPSIEVGTIGGGTFLPPQAAMLDLLGVRGAHPTSPGSNARQLARIIAAAVMAGELSLCSALAAGHLVSAHMQHNRAAPAAGATSTPALPPAAAQQIPKMTPINPNPPNTR